jgi:hypothetical protein
MKLYEPAAEILFEASLGARFPYDDRAAFSALIGEARGISLNAIFCVLHEVCRPPPSRKVTQQRQRELIAEWSSSFEHDLKAPLLLCAEASIGRQRLPWPDAIAVIEEIGRFQAQRAALAVAYFAGDCDSGEGGAALDLAEHRVRQAWETTGV